MGIISFLILGFVILTIYLGIKIVPQSKEYVVDSLSNERSMHHEFSVNPVQNRLQVISLSRVFRIEQF